MESLGDVKQSLVKCSLSRCDFCHTVCPVYGQEHYHFEQFTPRGKMNIGLCLLEGTLKPSSSIYEKFSTCSSCGNCSTICPFELPIVDVITKLRSCIVESGVSLLLPVKNFINNVIKYGNPWGILRNKRDAWADRIRRYETGDEYLLYVGCVGSYEERGQRVARSFTELLGKAGASFGILGSEEDCDGNEVYLLGELGLFQELAEKNTQKFKELGVEKVVTLSPHAYNAMKNKYCGDFAVIHYTQLLFDLVQKGQIELSELKTSVTYHDPCFLGRYNGLYDIPREVLRSIPGIELVEMERARENSLCCGGGSGNFVMDLLRGKDSPARVRVREAHETGAEILAVACPSCLMMLDDAVKDEGLEGKLAVRDISQLVSACSTRNTSH